MRVTVWTKSNHSIRGAYFAVLHREGVQFNTAQEDRVGAPLPIWDWGRRGEHLWSQAGTISGTRSQMAPAENGSN
jgi:hypothetical protein